MAASSQQPLLAWTRIGSLQCSSTTIRSFAPWGQIAKFMLVRSPRLIVEVITAVYDVSGNGNIMVRIHNISHWNVLYFSVHQMLKVQWQYVLVTIFTPLDPINAEVMNLAKQLTNATVFTMVTLHGIARLKIPHLETSYPYAHSTRIGT
jgi:hypothetical protein